MGAAGVTVITPTGGRPEAFALCQQFFTRQTWRGPVQWIVVDDGQVRTAHPELAMDRTSRIEYSLIRPEPFWQPGQKTLARNLLAAIPEVRHDRILIFEDDDFYPAGYIGAMVRALDSGLIAGCQDSWYYNVPGRMYRVFDHSGRSSLCHTGFRRELLPELEDICRRGAAHIDVELWESVESKDKVFFGEPLCIGIKGLPGRPGIGIGHQPEGEEWHSDPDGRVFRSWIGEDVRLYGTTAAAEGLYRIPVEEPNSVQMQSHLGERGALRV